MQDLSPNLERILLNFASFASLMGRGGYATILRETLLMPEPQRSEQLSILKYSISEILTLTGDESEFKDFVQKYDLSADSIKEFLRFLGPDSGLKYWAEDLTEVVVTLPSFLKSKIDEKLYDRVTLFVKLAYGKKYWDEIEYSEMKNEKLNELLEKVYNKSPKLAEYLYNNLK